MKNNNGKFLGLISGLFWGLDSVLLGLVLSSTLLINLGDSASFVTTFIHDAISFSLLLLLILSKRQLPEFKKVLFSKSGFAIITAALLGGPIGMTAYILSIQYIGASLSSSISAIYPIIGVLLAAIFLKEKIQKHNILGILISVLAIILMGLSALGTINNIFIGLGLVLICAVGWGSEAVIIKGALKEDVSSETALAIRQMVTMLTYALLIIPFIGYRVVIDVISVPSIISLIALSGVVGTISYLYYYKAIDVLGAIQAMGLNITYPAWAFLFQFLITGEFNLYLFSLSIVIIIGSILSNDNPKEFLTIFKK